jgi:hypothetical protein
MFRTSIIGWLFLISISSASLEAQYYHCRQDTILQLIDSTKALIKIDFSFSPSLPGAPQLAVGY